MTSIEIKAEQLTILWIDDSEQWKWISEGSDRVAKLTQCRYLLVCGNINDQLLEAGKNYEVSFQVKAGKDAVTADPSVTLIIQPPEQGFLVTPSRVQPNGEWQELKTEKFQPSETGKLLKFYFVNDKNTWKKGLFVKSAKITRVP